MAVTNVGITSASANTPVAIEQTTGMDAPVVGAAGDELTAPAEGWNYAGKVDFVSGQSKSLSVNGEDDLIVHIKNSDNYFKFSTAGASADKFVIADSNGKEQDTVSIVSVADGAGTDNTTTAIDNLIHIKLNKSIDSEKTFKLMVPVAEGLGATWTSKGTFTISPKVADPSGSGDTTAASGFQIPAGLSSKGTEKTGYKVGIAKVNGSNTDLANNEVKLDAIKDNNKVKSTWGDANVSANDYVLYYAPATDVTIDNVKFIKKLDDTEIAKLPITYKTEDTLSDSEKEVLEKYIKQYAGTYYFNTTPTWTGIPDSPALTSLTDLTSTAGITADKYYWVDKPAAIANTDAKKVGETTNVQPGQEELPAINAPTKSIKEDDELVNKIIEKYDAKNPTAKFNAQETFVQQNDQEEVTGDNGEVTTPAIAKGTILGAGWNALKDFAAANLADCFGETDQYKAVAERATAIYINYLNDQLYTNHSYDLSAVQWTLETLKTGSEKNAKNRDVYTAANKNAKFWGKSITKKYNSKTKAYTTNKGTADAAAARVEGATATITNTAANKSFNNTVYLKAVTDAYVNPSKTVTAASQDANVVLVQPFYITPALPSEFNSNVKLPAGLTSLSGDNTAGAKAVYTLTLKTGKSVKLPFKLKDGQEKDLVYDIGTGLAGFTVINGKVTGTAENTMTFATDATGVTEGENVIKVYSRANPSVYVLVQVKVEEEIKSIRANTTSLAIYPGSEQIVSLGTNPATSIGDGYNRFEITKPDGVDVKYMNNGTPTDLIDGKYAASNLIQVSAKSDATVNKGDKIVVKLAKDTTAVSTKSTKEFAITLSPATAPQDIKSVKTAVKSKITEVSKIDVNGDNVANENDIVKVINVPKGGSVNLGYAIAPVAANATIETGIYVYNSTTGEYALDNTNSVASVSGDVLKGENVGEAYVVLSPAADEAISDTFKVTGDANKNGQVVYKVNVYDPGEAIRFTDESYVVKGGFLMTKANADTSCDKNFTAGKPITMTPPSVDTTEKINWTANNPAAIKFEKTKVEGVDKLVITPLQTGTFTVTGMTEFTKQKMTFKINVVAANEGTATGANLTFTKADGSAFTTGVGQTAFKVGDKLNAFMAAGQDIGGKVVFTSSDKTVAAVTAKGLVTAKKAGKAKITAKMTYGTKSVTSEVELTVAPADIIVKSTKCAVGAVKSTPFAVSASLKNFNKSTMKLNWFAVTKGAELNSSTAKTALGDGLTDAKLSGKAQIGTAGSYDIYVEVKSGAETLSTIKVGSVDIYGTAVNGANVNNGDKDSKAAIANLAKAPKEGVESTAKYGTGHGYVYVPVFLTEKDGKTSKKYTGAVAAQDASDIIAGDGDIVWTSSNKSLARVVDFQVDGKGNYVNQEENDIIKNYKDAAGVAKIEVANTVANAKFTGMVTIKGTTKNSIDIPNKACQNQQNVI